MSMTVSDEIQVMSYCELKLWVLPRVIVCWKGWVMELDLSDPVELDWNCPADCGGRRDNWIGGCYERNPNRYEL